MIKTFADQVTRKLCTIGKTKRFPADVVKRTVRKLEYVDLATRLDDLKVPPGNRLHSLDGDRKGAVLDLDLDQRPMAHLFPVRGR